MHFYILSKKIYILSIFFSKYFSSSIKFGDLCQLIFFSFKSVHPPSTYQGRRSWKAICEIFPKLSHKSLGMTFDVSEMTTSTNTAKWTIIQFNWPFKSCISNDDPVILFLNSFIFQISTFLRQLWQLNSAKRGTIDLNNNRLSLRTTCRHYEFAKSIGMFVCKIYSLILHMYTYTDFTRAGSRHLSHLMRQVTGPESQIFTIIEVK